MVRRVLLLCFSLFGILKPSFSQYVITQIMPDYIPLVEYSTKHFQIIAPKSYRHALSVSGWMEHAYMSDTSWQHEPFKKKAPTILYSQLSQHNGRYVFTPERLELFTSPAQEGYARPVMQQLATHETRHLKQTRYLYQHTPKVIRWLFGQQSIGIYISVPFWFFEGDAIDAETEYSQTGRGREVDYLATMKALSLSGAKFSLEKMFYGSLKDYTPGYYPLGHFMYKGLQELRGNDVWKNTLRKTVRFPFIFSIGYRSQTKRWLFQDYRTLVNHTIERVWNEENHVDYTTYDEWVEVPKRYTDYTLINKMTDTSWLAVKAPFNKTPTIVVMSNSDEKKLTAVRSFSEHFTFRAPYVMWVEYRPDIRWSSIVHTDIKLFNINTKKSTRLQFKNSVYTPERYKDNIALVEGHLSGETGLSVYSLEGALKKSIQLPFPQEVRNPVWETDTTILAIQVDTGNRIVRWNINQNTITPVTQWQYNRIQDLRVMFPFIYFTSNNDKTVNIYRYSTQNHNIERVIISQFTLSRYVVNKKMVTYTDYSAKGFRPVTARMAPKIIDSNEFRYATQSTHVTSIVYDTATVVSKPYKRVKGLLNLHSWGPVSLGSGGDFSFDNVNIGPTLLSQNNLGTFIATLSYQYSPFLNTINTNVSYMGMFVKIQNDFSVKFLPTSSEIVNSLILFTPLDLSRSIYNMKLTPYLGLNYLNQGSSDLNLLTLKSGLQWQFQRQKTLQDIYPRWGIGFSGEYQYIASDAIFFNLSGEFFLPGLFTNHGLRNKIQTHYSSKYSYVPSEVPRGYPFTNTLEIVNYSVDYSFPIWYPDASIFHLGLWQRLRGELFFDYAITKDLERRVYSPTESAVVSVSNRFSSFGTTFTADKIMWGPFIELAVSFTTAWRSDQTLFNGFSFSINF